MTEINAHQFPAVYEQLGIEIGELGCIMLGVAFHDDELALIREAVPEPALYRSTNSDRWWIDGLVAEDDAHVTLLYGLMTPGPEQRDLVDAVLDGWEIGELRVEGWTVFPSTYDDEDYACIVARLSTQRGLGEAHARLSLLPHINTFDEYRPHVTIAYVRADVAEATLDHLRAALGYPVLQSTELDYGGRDSQ